MSGDRIGVEVKTLGGNDPWAQGQAFKTVEQLQAEIERLRADLRDWAECASVDVTMEGPRLMGWNRSALNRCLTKYEAALQPKEGE